MNKALSYCRACGAVLLPEPLARQSNMPKGAQDFPTKEQLADETGVDMELFQCAGCGVIQHTQPAVAYWRDVIRAVGFSPAMLAFRHEQLGNFARKYNLIGKTCMEFGCGDGAYLSVLQNTGMKAHGLENAAKAVRACVSKNLRVEQGFAEKERRFGQDAYDAFFVFSYLEHIPSIRDFLATVALNMRDGAVGLVEVPDFGMIADKGLFCEIVPDHIFYFTADTFKRVLENNGFNVLSCTSIWHGYILSAEVQKRRYYDLSHFLDAEKLVKEKVNKYLESRRRVAVWGAGHQSFALLAMAGIGGRIAYIVDSAPFKQGRYSPVTHIPIFAPEILNSDPVEALIVIGGSYSDEIAETAYVRYRMRDIAIFRDNGFESYQRREGM